MSRGQRQFDTNDAPNPATDDLRSIPIDEAVDLYLSKRQNELASATYQSHQSRLKWFVEFCSYGEIEETGDLTRPVVADFEEFRRDVANGEPAPSTMKSQVDTVRVFLKHLEKWGYLKPNVHVAADPPSLSKSQNIRYIDVDNEYIQRCLDYLRAYEYASRMHVCTELIWHTGIRLGAIHSLDLNDIHEEDNMLELRHRPHRGEGTTLKNGDGGERYVAVSDYVMELLQDWINDVRPHTAYKDTGTREALVTTRHGRAAKSTLRTDVYAATWPRTFGEECSCDPDEEGRSCWANNKNDGGACHDTVNPHALRKHAIVHHLDNEWRLEHVSDRVNSEPEVVKDHYDQAREEEKVERRRDFVDNL